MDNKAKVAAFKSRHPERYKEITRAAARKYYSKNAADIALQKTTRYWKLKEAGQPVPFDKYKSKRFTCECGGSCQLYQRSRHMTSRKHRLYLESKRVVEQMNQSN